MRRPAGLSSGAVLAVAWALSLGLRPSPPVHADAVPPPPSKCPRGQLPITSHRGPECVLPPPKDCPPGWRAEIRGVCRLYSCASDSDCPNGSACTEAELCLHEYLQEWGFTEAKPAEPAPRTDRPLYAGPPQRFDPPRKVTEAVDVCGGGRSCAAPARCGRGKVCLPRGVSRPGVWAGAKPGR